MKAPAEALKIATRNAAKKQRLNATGFRTKHGFSNGTFYDVWTGRRVPSLPILRKLKDAGVQIPKELQL